METSAKIENREVTVYNTTGKGYQIIKTTALSWKELKKSMDEARITYSNMKAVIGENQLTIESDDAQLPAEAFTLFLMPVKVKSGAGLDRKTLFENIKSLIAANPSMKNNFIVDGKNMTQLSTDKLNELWAKYGAKGGNIPSPAAKVTEVVAAVKQAEEKSKAAEPAPATVSEKDQLLAELDEFLKNNVDEEDSEIIMGIAKKLASLILETSSDFVPSFTVEETDEDIQRKLEKYKESYIANMAEKLRGKFPDVK